MRINITLSEGNYSDELIMDLLGEGNCNTKAIKKLLLQMAIGTQNSNNTVTEKEHISNYDVTNKTQKRNVLVTDKIHESNSSVTGKELNSVNEDTEKLLVENKPVVEELNFDKVVLKNKDKTKSKIASTKDTMNSIINFKY